MKEQRSYRKFSAMSTLAGVGFVFMILVQLFFMLELYRIDIEPERLPAFLRPAPEADAAPAPPEEEPEPVPAVG